MCSDVCIAAILHQWKFNFSKLAIHFIYTKACSNYTAKWFHHNNGEPIELRIYTSCLYIDNRGYCGIFIDLVSNLCQKHSLHTNESERSTAEKKYELKSDNMIIQKNW